MALNIQAVRGMNDILPHETGDWQHLETILREVMAAYAYREIRFPIVEKTELFKRSIGEVTDIVEKEMYTFADRNGESLTLRPEGTACCVRAVIEHGLLHQQEQRLWYMGPMFRHERPQKGRYRQFHQLGVEALGLAGPDIDLELLLMTARLWQRLNINDAVVLHINSLGSNEARLRYRDELVNYFSKQRHRLDEDSQRRLESNPLRILDSKNPEMQELIEHAPQMLAFLDTESVEHFDYLKRGLTNAKINYVINPRLVRGLDYYNHTVFEWMTNQLGAQGTICAGGRFDGLVELLGGKPTPAVGFAMGLERMVALLAAKREAEAAQQESDSKKMTETMQQIPDVYFIMSGEKAAEQGLLLAEKVRDALPKLRLYCHCGGGSFKSQFKRADKSGAKWAMILGDEEVATETVSIKHLRDEQLSESASQQQRISQNEIVNFFKKIIFD